MAVELERIERQHVADVVIDQLLDLMITGKLRSGEKLPGESDLAGRLGVGRNSVREALKVLQTLGILERHQGNGSYVAESYKMPFDWMLFPLLSKIGTSQDLVELRRVIELGVTELVIEKACVSSFDRLEAKLNAFERAGARDDFDVDEVVQRDVEFHTCLAELTGNSALVELSKLVMKLFQPSMKAHLTSPEGFEVSASHHRSVFEAITTRDHDQARRSIVAAFEEWKRFIDVS